MIEQYFTSIYSFVSKHMKAVHAIILLLIIISAAGLKDIRLSNNIESMLPARKEIKRSIKFLRESGLSDKVVLSVSCKNEASDINDLIRDADALTEMLKCDLITDVLSTVPEGNMMDELVTFMSYIPQLSDKDDLARINSELTKDHIEKRVSQIYTKLLTPGGSFMTPFFRVDPLSISGELMKNMQSLSAALGYNVDIAQGRLVSTDKKNLLIVLETPVLMTDGTGSKKLLHHIATCVDSFNNLSVKIVAGHVHSVSNERVIRKDVTRTCIIASIAFFLLFLLVCKDARVGFVFLMPLIAILMAINLSGMILGSMSYFIAGFGAVIAGIAIDYGIHVYIAKKHSGDEGVKFVAKPVIIGALTTLSVFFAFFFSSVKGYAELACFSIISILLCLVLSLLFLPHLIKQDTKSTPNPTKTTKQPNSGTVITCWVLFLCICGFLTSKLVIDTDIKNFDGSEPEVIADENEFNKIWGGGDQPAIMVSEANSFEEAMKVNSISTKEGTSLLGDDKLLSLASIWKPYEIRKQNLTEWNHFWQDGAEKKLRKLLWKAARKRDFTREMFDPFFDSLYLSQLIEGVPNDLEFLGQVLDRFVVTKDNKTMILSYFDDTKENINRLTPFTSQRDDVYLVSRNQLSISISDAVESEIIKLSLIGGLLIVCLLFILLHKPRLVLLALIPVITAMACMLALLPLIGMSLNAASIISAMVVVGLCIDYGIFMIYHQKRPSDSGLRLAVGLSAATTVIGAGALLFAAHPVMFSIGITLTSGVISGYAGAVVVLPAMYKLTGFRK